MRRSIVLLILALLGALVPASAAHAIRPQSFPASDFTLQLDSGDLCPFAVEVTTVQNNEIVRFFFDRGGNFLRGSFTGKLFVRVTNLETGQSIVLNVSGPSQFYPDGRLVQLGLAFIGLIRGIDEGAPALLLTRGRVTLRRTEFGGLADVTITSHRVDDICSFVA